MESFAAYDSVVLGVGSFGALMLLQLLVADVISILRKHPPGTSVESGHSDVHFRSVRAHANSVETAAVFLLVTAFAVLRSARPETVELWVWVFVGARGAHMAFYWLDWRTLRSIAFTVATIALVALLVAGF